MAARRRKGSRGRKTRKGRKSRKVAPRAKPAGRRPRRKQATRAAAKRGARVKTRRKPAVTRKTKRRAQPAPRPTPAAGPHRLVSGAALEIGVVSHYFPRAGAAVVVLSRPIHRRDTIHVRGATTDFVQAVDGLALDGAPVAAGVPPQSVGVRLEQRARVGDRVYRISW